MKTKMFASIALLGLSIGTAQAVTLNYTDSYTFDGEVDFFYFDNNSSGNVSLWVDTLQDGLATATSIFKKNNVNGAYEWTGIPIADGFQTDFDLVLGYNTTGFNDFGVALKNGYIQDSQTALGYSDDGAVLNLDAGSYLYVVTGFRNMSVAEFTGNTAGTIDDGFVDLNTIIFGNNPEEQWSTWSFNTAGAPSPYKVYIEGDVSETVSSIPVPAAVWFFTTAIAGLGVVGRSKKQR